MFCPRCAVQNTDDARFCRACGADISLVTQALSGQAIESPLAHGGTVQGQNVGRQHGGGKPPSIERAVESIGMGAAFLVIFITGLLVFRNAFMVWVWFIIPALTCIGKGAGQYLRYKQEQPHFEPQRQNPAPLFQPSSAGSPAPQHTFMPHGTSELLTPPAGATEGTTRHLDDAVYKRADIPKRAGDGGE